MEKFGRTFACVVAGVCLGCGEVPTPEACNPAPDEYPGLPAIDGLIPRGGPPGTTVRITGENFDRIDARYAVLYGDIQQTCSGLPSLDGAVRSSTEIEGVVIPEDATQSGHLYLVSDERVISRSPQPFQLERNVATIIVHNGSQFPIVKAEVGWEPVLGGTRIDVEEAASFEVEPGPMHLELCVGDAQEPWACQVFDGRLGRDQTIEVSMGPVRAAELLAGEWVGTWMVGEDVYEERMWIEVDGYWELRHRGRVIDSGEVVEPDRWPAYQTQFAFRLRPDADAIQVEAPVRTFSLESQNAGDRLPFYRPR